MINGNNEKGRVTELLLEIGEGGQDAYNQLFPIIYHQLKGIAHNQLLRRTASGELQRTELIHEVYLKLIDQTQAQWKDRAHFFTVAAKAMRHILVDHYRKQKSGKRGGSKEFLALDANDIAEDGNSEYLEELHELMDQLARVNERMHAIVDLRFFAGMTIEEIAGLLDLSTSTVDREWKAARIWLYHNLKNSEV